MAKSPSRIVLLEQRLEALGLKASGGFTLPIDCCPEGREDFAGRPAILVGNVGKSMWNVFRKSPEFSDGAPDPMNRWTEREITSLADEFGASPVFPFEKPFWPFQRLATAAIGMQPSPLGLLIHPEYGLWHAFRSVMIFDPASEIAIHFKALGESFNKLNHPCVSCEDKPCLTACPVGAFTESGLEVDACFSHLDSGRVPDCMQLGCAARNACPVGLDHRYENEQIRFHMNAYRY